jgi:tripartite-type tricarboxylate transporter receptor subunit TctC
LFPDFFRNSQSCRRIETGHCPRLRAAEAGLPGFDSSVWFAVLVAKRTPDPLRVEIERAVVSALNDDDVKKSLAAVGISVVADGPGELAHRIERESGLWRDVILKAGIKAE